MADLPVHAASLAGGSFAWEAATGTGDEFVNTGREAVLINNGSGIPITVTFVTQATVDGLDVADRTVVIDAGQIRVIGPFPKATYNDPDGKVALTYSEDSGVEVAVVRVA